MKKTKYFSKLEKMLRKSIDEYPTATENLSLRIPIYMKRNFVKIAKDNNKPISSIIRSILQDHLDSIGKDIPTSGDVGGTVVGIENPGIYEEHWEDQLRCKKKIGFN